MTEHRQIRVVGSDGLRNAKVAIATEPPWLIGIQLQDGTEVAVEETDLFASLQTLRLKLEAIGILLCCHGALANVFPSGMARQMAEGRRAYRITRGQRPTRDDLMDIFAPADCSAVVTVQQQMDWIERCMASDSSRGLSCSAHAFRSSAMAGISARGQ